MPKRAAMKRKGAYITKKEIKVLKEGIQYMKYSKRLSEEEKSIFKRIEDKIKNPDIMKRSDYRRNYSENIWLSPGEAKFLIAWKDSALKEKSSEPSRKYPIKGIKPEEIGEKYKELFKKELSKPTVIQHTKALRSKGNIDFSQLNVSSRKTRKSANISDPDRRIIKWITIDKLSNKEMARRLDVTPKTIGDRIKNLKKLGLI